MPTERGRTNPNTERVITTLHPHGRVLVWPSLVLIVDAGAASYYFGSFSDPRLNQAVLAGAALVLVLFWLLPLLAWLSKRYTVTTRRIIVRRGLFVRTRQELLHSRGYNVTLRQNFVQSLFGSGDVVIDAGLDRPIILRDAPMAVLVLGSLHDLMETALNPIAARRQAGDTGPRDETSSWGRR